MNTDTYKETIDRRIYMQDINLKAFRIPKFHLDETSGGIANEVFYVSDSSEDDFIEIIPESSNNIRSNKKIYIVLYLKGCSICRAESFSNEIEDPAEALENMNKWVKVSAFQLFG